MSIYQGDIKIAGNTSAPLTGITSHDFIAVDWVLSGDEYTLTFPKTAEQACTDIYRNLASSKEKVMSGVEITDTSVKLTSLDAFDGSCHLVVFGGAFGPGGVVAGGSTGQVLKKKSDADFDTEWGDSSSSGALTGFRNKIINGCFSVNQRNKSGAVTLTSSNFGHDRWKAGEDGCTYTFTTINNVTTITITSGTLKQGIEGNNIYSGAHVLSWEGTSQGRMAVGYGSAEPYGSSGITITATGGSVLFVEFGVGTIANVQLEEGSSPTTFEKRPYQIEEILCKRYYRKILIYQWNYEATSVVIGTYVNLSPAMRGYPTITMTGHQMTIVLSDPNYVQAKYTVSAGSALECGLMMQSEL